LVIHEGPLGEPQNTSSVAADDPAVVRCREAQGHLRPLPEAALDAGPPAVQLRDAPNDGQTEADAARGGGARSFGAIETLEHVRQVLDRDAAAGVGDGDP